MSAAALILIADDSTLIRTMLRASLVQQGYAVAESSDGEEALKACSDLHPDVILLDVEMPVLDGYQVLEALKRDPTLSDTPVVFLTVRAEIGDVVRGLRMGAHDYLRKPFDESELMARVSAALRVKRLQDELRRRNEELDYTSRIDPLTGVFNRRQLDHELARLHAETTARGATMGALMIDVDRFKLINDTLGHAVGDRVLQSISTRLQVTISDGDIFGRWGGEEFLVLVAGSSHEQLALLAERARFAIDMAPVVIDMGASGPAIVNGTAAEASRRGVSATVSIGGAVAASCDPEELVRRADTAMYKAKRAGRNRVMMADAADCSS